MCCKSCDILSKASVSSAHWATLSQELDPNYEPTQEEVDEYAKWLGMQLPEDEDLLYIAREGGLLMCFSCRYMTAISKLFPRRVESTTSS